MQSQLEGRVNGNQHSLQDRDQKNCSPSTRNSSSIQYASCTLKELHIILSF